VAGKSRPFESCLVKNQKKMVEVPDAAVERLDKLKASLEDAQERKDAKATELLLKLVGGQKSVYNLDNNHYMNVIDTQGNIGVLKLRHTAKKALDVVIRGLRDKGIDPLDPDNGRLFTFTRSGMGRDTTFACKVATKAIFIDGVGEVEQAIVHKLDEATIGRFKNEAVELQKLFKKPTAAQVDQIVAESKLQTGVSANIDAILGYKVEEAAGDGDAESEETGETVNTETGEVIGALTGDVTASGPAPEAKVAPIVETKAEAKAEVRKAAPAATTAQKVADMSDDEFMSSLGLK
jgi:hypothetical protein